MLNKYRIHLICLIVNDRSICDNFAFNSWNVKCEEFNDGGDMDAYEYDEIHGDNKTSGHKDQYQTSIGRYFAVTSKRKGSLEP